MDDGIRALSAESAAIWDTNAEAWDARMGDEGNGFQRLLVAPAAERLLCAQRGQLILDVACGNGVFSRRLARLGARVVACDFSAALIERARARSEAQELAGQVSYQVVDATDEAQLLALGEGRFDGAVCNMALMDMAAIEPLFNALARLLKPGGPFVFSVMHPCFNTTSTLMVENWDEAGTDRTVLSVKVSQYLGLAPTKGLAIMGQPLPQHYFHRPLHALFAAGFKAGFAVDGLEEPAFTPEQAKGAPLLSWMNFTEIPPVMVVRMRPA
jgi:2-polyprenyl-3-methyl-5-hydroxy-6-metoxy-1,4-benzoquinol methylase